MFDLKDFLIKAKKETYANGNAKKISSSRQGSKDYSYQEIIDNKKAVYHDTYFGGECFIGEEVVYYNSANPIWGMNYRGITIDKDFSEEAMDNALRPALMKVGEDKSVLPLRGPSKFENGEYLYTFEYSGDILNFNGVEKIYKNGKLIYQLTCSGGEII